MLDSGMTENTENCIYIADISYNVLRDMVDFIYTAEAPQFELHSIELLLAADRYELKRLKVWCAGYNRAQTFIMIPENKQKLNEMERLTELQPAVLADLFVSSPLKCCYSD
ncbi:hypothetical protein HA402_000725 [Bradysia odoriphaga]|nr:hypothetical protein HA402_000725 [Bradysia odoriphaga]